MAGFVRRFGTFPSVEQITTIEGIVIADLPPSGPIQGVGAGVVGIFGEFADVTYGVSVDTTGTVTTSPNPVEIFGPTDLVNKLGGFDETLGDFGGDDGNGYVALRNKTFSRLVAVPINLASSKGVRMFRDLPTCKSATNPDPIVPLQAASVKAGYEFKTGANKIRTMAKVTFTDAPDFVRGTDGSVPTAATATSTFTSAGSNFNTAKFGAAVDVGDILVIGVETLTVPVNDNIGTFRVTAVPSATTLTIENLDGSNLNLTSTGSLPWRLYTGAVADSGGKFAVAGTGAYIIPARPLNATIAADTVVSPTVIPAAATLNSWDPLSGLRLRTIATTGLVYTANVQAANQTSTAEIKALYQTAINAALSQDLPEREINITIAARTALEIRSYLKQHELSASSQGIGRVSIISPPISTVSASTILGDADPGVGAQRDESTFYSWPGAQTSVPEAVGYNIKIAYPSGATTSDGILDTRGDVWLASVLSNLAPERNPGQAAPPVPQVLAPVLGLQRGVSGLGMPEYAQMRAKGVCGLRIDRIVGPIFQSGVTTSLVSGQKNINRRRMAYFIQDSLAAAYLPFTKLPLTNQFKDGVVAETVAFLSTLLSEDNPAAQRIKRFEVDSKGGNTQDLEALGIYVVIVRVRTLPTADFIVVQSEVGENVLRINGVDRLA